MSTDFDDVIQTIQERYEGFAADNTASAFTWSLNITWKKISLDNPVVQRALKSKAFKSYYSRWCDHWHQKTLEGRTACFEAALISFMGYLFKTAIEKLSDGDITVLNLLCNAEGEDKQFDYIACRLDADE